ncbi:MAG TPA: sensor histidine kinase [Streptosporangiaceae bacterium]|nr:sensor histidine kinase [Streptosporangiaceae bacterium]
MKHWQSPAAHLRRIAAIPHAPALLSLALALAGAAQSLAWTAANPTINTQVNAGELEIAMMLPSVAATVPLGLLWGQPVIAALVVTAACLLSMLAFHTLTVAAMIAALILLYRLGRSGQRQWLAPALAAPFLVLALISPGSSTRVSAVLLAALGQAAGWAGIATRARKQASEHSAARQVIAGSLLEHTARGERARISRELHDVVAHHISMIAVQAETARLTTPDLPATGAQRLSCIGDTARSALTEMRRLLGVLREDTGADPADLRPQPSLRQLNELIDEARDASASTTRLIVRGTPIELDPGVELAGYRIIQEALTNSRRHAPGAAVDVELHYSPHELTVRIRDNGPGPPLAPPIALPADGSADGSAATSHGLLGMRERAAAVGGSLRTGRDACGGFIVEASLPAISAITPLTGRSGAGERAEATG